MKYKWCGSTPLKKGAFRYQEKDYLPGDIMPDGVDEETLKSLLSKGKIEEVSVDKPKAGTKGDKK